MARDRRKKRKLQTLSSRLSKLGYDSYDDYLESLHWRKIRRSYFAALDEKRCWCCGVKSQRLHLHHATYVRLGKERLSDLIHVCFSCHNEIHRRVKTTKIRLHQAHSVLRSENIRSGVFRGSIAGKPDKPIVKNRSPKPGKRAWQGVKVTWVDPVDLVDKRRNRRAAR